MLTSKEMEAVRCLTSSRNIGIGETTKHSINKYDHGKDINGYNSDSDKELISSNSSAEFMPDDIQEDEESKVQHKRLDFDLSKESIESIRLAINLFKRECDRNTQDLQDLRLAR
jgi:hypothetical protein